MESQRNMNTHNIVDFLRYPVHSININLISPRPRCVVTCHWWQLRDGSVKPALAGDNDNVTQSRCHQHDASSHCHQSARKANSMSNCHRDTYSWYDVPVLFSVSDVSISWAQIQCFLCRAYYWLRENKYKVLWGYSNCWGSPLSASAGRLYKTQVMTNTDFFTSKPGWVMCRGWFQVSGRWSWFLFVFSLYWGPYCTGAKADGRPRCLCQVTSQSISGHLWMSRYSRSWSK